MARLLLRPQGPTVGKYVVNVASFEALALPQLQPRPGVELYVVDEVGEPAARSLCELPALQRSMM